MKSLINKTIAYFRHTESLRFCVDYFIPVGPAIYHINNDLFHNLYDILFFNIGRNSAEFLGYSPIHGVDENVIYE